MALATLSIDLEARLAKLQEGFDKATREADKSSAKIAQSFERLNSVAAGLGGALAGAFSAAAIGQWVRATADGLDALNDAADATGASVENLSALESIGNRTGTAFDTVAATLIKFNQQLAAAGDKTSEASAIFNAIGLDAEKLRRMDPALALKETADALAKYADNGDKARLVQQLLGKGVQSIAPFLKDLAEQGLGAGTATAELVRQADAFNKNIAQMDYLLQGASRRVFNDFIPAINQALATLIEAQRVFGSLPAAIKGGLFRDPFSSLQEQTAKAEANLASLEARVAKINAQLEKPDLIDRFRGAANIRIDKADAEKELAAQRQLVAVYRNRLAAMAAANAPAADLPNVGVPVRTPRPDGKPGDGPSLLKFAMPESARVRTRRVDDGGIGEIGKSLERWEAQEQRRVQVVADAGEGLLLATERLNIDMLSSDRARGEAQIELERRFYASRLSQLGATLSERADLETKLNAYVLAQQAQLTEQLKPEWQRMVDGWSDTTALMAKSYDDLMAGVVIRGEDALTDLVKNGKLSVGSLVDFVQEQIARLIAQQAIAKIGDIANLMINGFSITPSAKGNVFSGGAVTPFATGGVVGLPTYFPMRGGKTGLMGEAGPEAIMPLARDNNGRLGVRGGGGGGPVINLHIASGVSRAELSAMLPTLQAQIEASLIGRSRRPGSVL